MDNYNKELNEEKKRITDSKNKIEREQKKLNEEKSKLEREKKQMEEEKKKLKNERMEFEKEKQRIKEENKNLRQKEINRREDYEEVKEPEAKRGRKSEKPPSKNNGKVERVNLDDDENLDDEKANHHNDPISNVCLYNHSLYGPKSGKALKKQIYRPDDDQPAPEVKNEEMPEGSTPTPKPEVSVFIHDNIGTNSI